jgi:glyoxylase-like metal-dependent hydrolase (beta-lactamase superfamily II)
VLRPVAEGVLIHESEFCQSNAVVVPGWAGVLLIDGGIYGSEMACLASDLSEAGQTVAAGFSTHPHWDHVLWHARFGAVPRYGTDLGEQQSALESGECGERELVWFCGGGELAMILHGQQAVADGGVEAVHALGDAEAARYLR